MEAAMAQGSVEPVGSVGVPASEHGAGFPPFNAHTFASQLLWLALIFLALYLLMSRIALPRIGSILEARRQRIQDDLADARKRSRTRRGQRRQQQPKRVARRWTQNSMPISPNRKRPLPKSGRRQWAMCATSPARLRARLSSG